MKRKISITELYKEIKNDAKIKMDNSPKW